MIRQGFRRNFKKFKANVEGFRFRYFSCVWCKSSTRKHKKWEDDGILIVKAQSRLAILQDVNGKELGRASGMARETLEKVGNEQGGSLSLGGKEVEIMDEIGFKGAVFMILTLTLIMLLLSKSLSGYNKLKQDNKSETKTEPIEELNTMKEKENTLRPKVISKAVFKPFAAPSKFGFKPNETSSSSTKIPITPMFSPDKPDSLVMPRPPFHCIANNESQVINFLQIQDNII